MNHVPEDAGRRHRIFVWAAWNRHEATCHVRRIINVRKPDGTFAGRKDSPGNKKVFGFRTGPLARNTDEAAVLGVLAGIVAAEHSDDVTIVLASRTADDLLQHVRDTGEFPLPHPLAETLLGWTGRRLSRAVQSVEPPTHPTFAGLHRAAESSHLGPGVLKTLPEVCQYLATGRLGPLEDPRRTDADGCRCGKVRYDSWDLALEALLAITSRRDLGYYPKRVYACPTSRQWHLTSRATEGPVGRSGPSAR
ncbi:hypothetical protein [Kitasatospora sp. NPDC002965]|uniref:hypothetical protein n=1 Tax=Kitasatospora sp. NPDC002965 TaxID=3154775 RepID=UPI0033BC16EC